MKSICPLCVDLFEGDDINFVVWTVPISLSRCVSWNTATNHISLGQYRLCCLRSVLCWMFVVGVSGCNGKFEKTTRSKPRKPPLHAPTHWHIAHCCINHNKCRCRGFMVFDVRIWYAHDTQRTACNSHLIYPITIGTSLTLVWPSQSTAWLHRKVSLSIAFSWIR